MNKHIFYYKMLISGLLLSLFASAALADELIFDASHPSPISFEPFTIENAEGVELPRSMTAVLELEAEEKQLRESEMQQEIDEMISAGFEPSAIKESGSFQPQTLSVGEYIDQMNTAERAMNQYGYSLRSTDPESIEEVQKIDQEKIQDQVVAAKEVYAKAENSPSYDETKAELDAKHSEVKNNIAEYKERYKKPSAKRMYLESKRDKCEPAEGEEVSTDHVECFVDEMENPDSGSRPFVDPNADSDTCSPDTKLGKSFLLNENWSDSGGDSNFGWVADAKFKLQTDISGLTLKSSADAEGLFLTRSKKVLEAKASFTSPQKGTAKGSFSVRVLGSDVIDPVNKSWDLHLIDSKDDDGQEKYITHKEVSILSTVIPMGFVPVTLSLDAKLSMGPRYQLDLMPVKIYGSAEWINRLTLIASAGIGADLELFVILAGVKGYIDLFDATIGSYSEAGLALENDVKPKIFAKFNAKAKMRTLSGSLRLGVWAKSTFSVPQPRSSFPFVEMKPYKYEWSTKLGDYPGYEFPTAVLFEKKVGYDVCTGQKTVETIKANEPRDRTERQSFEVAELSRISGLESKASQLMDEELYSDIVASVKTEASRLLATVEATNTLRSTINHELLTGE